MARYSMLDEAPPADAITHRGIRYILRNNGPRPCITIWYGKSKRPKRWSFRNAEQRQQWIDSQMASQDSGEQEKVRRQAAKDQSVAEMCERIQVGTLLCYSWGYDQTNIDFFQVVRRSGRSVWVRRIGGRVVEGSEGFMSNRVMPARDSFLEYGEHRGDGNLPVKKLIGAYGLSMDHGTARPCGDNEAHYQSWYA